MEFKELSEIEKMYADTQCSNIAACTREWGYAVCTFQPDMSNDVMSSWHDRIANGKPMGIEDDALKVCYEFRKKLIDGAVVPGDFRVDMDGKTFICSAIKAMSGIIRLSAYAYSTNDLDEHIDLVKNKRIRFVTPEYDNMFMLDDGDSLRIERPAFSSTHEEKIRYLDEYHTLIGSAVYHICEFGEAVENAGLVLTPLRNSLPEQCWVYDPEEMSCILVRKGADESECVQRFFADEETAMRYADTRNVKLGVFPSKYQIQAMLGGIKEGWCSENADPVILKEKAIVAERMRSVKSQEASR